MAKRKVHLDGILNGDIEVAELDGSIHLILSPDPARFLYNILRKLTNLAHLFDV